jgi:methylmalonyl-CoA/ethylmalonyl-CoA epimerase
MDDQTQKPLPFLNNGIAQVAILVPDLMAAIKHYYEDFGIGPWDIYTYQKPLVSQMTYHGKPADYAMRIGLSYIGPMRVELIQPLRGESVYADHIAEHGYGLHHFGLLVDNMETALKEAEAAGYEMTMDGSGFGLDGDGHYAYLDTEDRLGVTYELIERPKRRHKPVAVYPPKKD